jgi:hypothetical protein
MQEEKDAEGFCAQNTETTLQRLQEEMDAKGLCAQNTEDYATVTVRRDGCREVLCIEHRRLRYSDRKKR